MLAQMLEKWLGHHDLAQESAVAAIDPRVLVGQLDLLDAELAAALVRRMIPADHPFTGEQTVELVLDQCCRSARTIADGAKTQLPHPFGEGLAEPDVPGSSPDRFGHDVN